MPITSSYAMTAAATPVVSAIPGGWVYTTLPTGPGAAGGMPGAPAFLTPDERDRLDRIRQVRMLLDGRHREYFLDEGRTQFDFPRVRAGGRLVPLYLTYNVLGLISLKGTDLLFGDAPLLRATSAAQQAALDALAERCALHRLLYACALDASAEGECFLEACAHRGEVYLRQVPADEVFPVGSVQPDGQYAAYVRRRVRNVGTDEAPVILLLEVTYLPGRIERRCFALDPDRRGRTEVSLESWSATAPQNPVADAVTPEPGGHVGRGADGRYAPLPSAPLAPLAPVTPVTPVTHTWIGRNTITWIPNQLVRGAAVSDYDGAVELQDALNAKNSQVGRVLLKHSDPRMAMPEEMFDEQGNVRTDQDVFAFTDPHRLPRYVTWDAELQHAMADRAFVLNQLLVRTETSPALLGLKEGAAPEAYKKVRLESFNSLAKAGRKAAFWKSGLSRALAVAQDLENALPNGPRYVRGPIAIELRDGIPMDELERAQRLAVLRGAGLISLERALEEQLQDPSAVEKELARIRAEHPDDTPVH
jgi:hypothetical protein